MLKLNSCKTCSKAFKEDPNWLGQCPDCAQICWLTPVEWTPTDTTFRRQRPAHVHPRDWVLDPNNGLVAVAGAPPDSAPVEYPGHCWEWQPGQHHAPQASPALFESPLAPEMHWATRGKSGRQVPAYYLFIGEPPEGLRQPEADHYCCNRRCINPLHISWVSKDENTRRNQVRARYAALRRSLQEERITCPRCQGTGQFDYRLRCTLCTGATTVTKELAMIGGFVE